MARLLKHHLSVYLSVGPSVRPSVHPFFHLSVGSKPVHFSRLTLFTVVLSALHHQASLRVQAWNRHRYHFWFLWRGFGVGRKQTSRSKCHGLAGSEPRTWQSNDRERYNYHQMFVVVCNVYTCMG